VTWHYYSVDYFEPFCSVQLIQMFLEMFLNFYSFRSDHEQQSQHLEENFGHFGHFGHCFVDLVDLVEHFENYAPDLDPRIQSDDSHTVLLVYH